MFFFLKSDRIKYKSRFYIIRFSLLWKFLKAYYHVSTHLDAGWQGLMNPSSTGLEPGGM